MEALIRKNGSDLVVEVTAINNSGVGVPVTMTASIEKRSGVNLYYDNVSTNFDSATAVNITVPYVREGLHALVLAGEAESLERAYRINVVITGAGALNTNATFSSTIEAEASISVWNAVRASFVTAGTFGEFTNANLTNIAGSPTVDTVSIADYFERSISYISGKFEINFPAAGDITFFKQNNTTSKYVMHITPTIRTRL